MQEAGTDFKTTKDLGQDSHIKANEIYKRVERNPKVKLEAIFSTSRSSTAKR
jgi:hypothetical protein